MIKVIIVEDDPMVAMINQQYIERSEGFKIIASSNLSYVKGLIKKSITPFSSAFLIVDIS